MIALNDPWTPEKLIALLNEHLPKTGRCVDEVGGMDCVYYREKDNTRCAAGALMTLGCAKMLTEQNTEGISEATGNPNFRWFYETAPMDVEQLSSLQKAHDSTLPERGGRRGVAWFLRNTVSGFQTHEGFVGIDPFDYLEVKG